jgi:CheY-like chemotaxis protein
MKTDQMENTIVVVNDEPDIRKMIKLIKLVLTKNKISTNDDEQVHIEEAARLVAEHFKPDVIRLDIKMPGLDRAEIYQLLQEEPTITVHPVTRPQDGPSSGQ